MRGKSAIHSYNLCLLGFGNVNRTLVRLLLERKKELNEQYGISCKITGVASRRLGWVAAPGGLDPVILLEGARSNHLPHISPPPGDVRTWLRSAHADVLFEATSLNVTDGQPAVDHIRAALEARAHAITANKGPVLHAFEELTKLAAQHGRRFLFESTVMDGVPIFSLFRENLPAIHLRGFRGILNSTTNVIITGMEEGLTFDESLKRAQAVGVAETDAADDIDGWDAAIKTALLVRVLMGVHIDLNTIKRDSIRNLAVEAVKAARREGQPYKVVCRATRAGSGVQASVRLERVPLRDPMAHVTGTSSVIYFETDTFPGLAITEDNPGLEATAYGMLADFVRASAHDREHVK